VDSFLTYVPLISVAIVAGLFLMALMNFSTIRKNMQMQIEQQMKSLKAQSEQQIYSKIMDAATRPKDTTALTMFYCHAARVRV
jgi:high-affinity Fe2+/Pb2+ permease